MDEPEEWRDVEGFPNWTVSNYGRIMNEWTGRVLKPRMNREKVLMLALQRDGVQFTRSVALLVARAFLDEPTNENYNSIIHVNGDKADCTAWNLEWRPRWFTVRYHKQFNEGAIEVPVYLTDTDEVFEDCLEPALKYGLLQMEIYKDLMNQNGVGPERFIFKRYKD